MKILFFTNVYPVPHHSTRGAFNAALVRALRDVGNDVRCVVPVNFVERLRARRRGTRPIVHEQTAFRTWFAPPGVLRQHYHRFMWWRLRGTLRQVTRDWRPDVVLAYWIHPDGDVAQRFARTLGVPVVAMAGGSDLLIMTKDPARRRAVARVLQSVDGVITIGRQLSRAAIDLGADPARVVAFYHGVDTEVFCPGDRAVARQGLGVATESRLLLAVGNLVRVKGMDILLRAVAAAGDAAPWQVAIVGDGELRDALERQTAELGIGDRVRFLGRMPQGELREWYRAADLVALTSRSEGVPNVLLEALACNTPFRAPDVGGIAEITPDASWLVPPEDPEAFAVALRKAYLDPGTVPPHETLDGLTAARMLTDQLQQWRNAAR